MKSSSTTKGLADALAKAQSIIANPEKSATNPHFKSKYATLDTGLNIVRDALSKNGIAFTQTTRMDGDVMMLDTRLTHGNEFMESEYPICRFPAKQQEIGSALTYGKRYSLFSFVGIAGEDDDDGNAATTPASAPKTDVKAIIETLSFCYVPADVETWWKDNKATLSRLPKPALDEVIAACSAKKSALANAEAA